VRSRIGKVVEVRGEPYVTCEEVITFLLDYLAHELEPEEEASFERHLAICPSCVAYLETYQEAVRMSRETVLREELRPPGPLGVELARAILASRHEA
jgi:anti-sigma factor RsiW